MDNLKRLGSDAMGPCHACGRQLLETGLPIYYRVQVSQCGIDANEVRKHVGVAVALGGGTGGLALASAMGPKVEPVVVFTEGPTLNICSSCQQKPEWMMLADLALTEADGTE